MADFVQLARPGPRRIGVRNAATAAILLSSLGHAALVLYWTPQRPAPIATRPQPLVIELGPARTAPVAALAPTKVVTTVRRRASEPRPEVQTAPLAQPAPEPMLPSAPASGTSRKLDLVPHDELGRITAAGPVDRGGHLRREGDGGARDDSDHGELAASRVKDMVRDLVGRQGAQAGRVAHGWRVIERELGLGFHPPVATVKVENRVLGLVRQIFQASLDGPPKSAPLARGQQHQETMIGTPEGMNMRNMPAEQAAAIQGHWGAPVRWLTVEIEVTTDADGQIAKIRVLAPSGRRIFDKAALAAVEKTLATSLRAHPPEEHRRMVSLWSVAAAVAVAPPNSLGIQFDEAGQLNPGVSGIGKYASATYPFKETVKTKVALLRVDPD